MPASAISGVLLSFLAFAAVDSGTPLPAEQAAYDVRSYSLELRVDPDQQSIAGKALVSVKVLEDLPVLLLDLDEHLTVSQVLEGGEARPFRHDEGRLWIDFPRPRTAGTGLEVEVHYAGRPRVAPRPPWDGGFTWAHTAGGDPWITTSNQLEGADLWWPCKDQPSDEPDRVALRITVPAPLVCVANGVLRGVEDRGDGTRTFHWETHQPINNYGVALNIAPYRSISQDFTSVDGTRFPVTFWVLPENLAAGEAFLPEILEHLRFFERNFGPYPFRAEKYGVVETPHLGMEHQTIIAYGNRYQGGPDGFDWLHHHELAHEWWGNLVSARDWKDFWIHEGFATYCQALHAEEKNGRAAYLRKMEELQHGLGNQSPLAPAESRSTRQMYSRDTSADIYYKGACVLHTLRFVMGDAAFREALRTMAYPTAERARATDGSQCRFTDTEEFLAIASRCAGQDLGWFFDVYVRQPQLPVLEWEAREGLLLLRWRVPGGLAFPMPVEVELGGKRGRLDLPAEGIAVALGSKEPVLDPEHWILKNVEEGW